jgi:CRP/FNR family cyclic AMP-dependent transcriptional regulator
VYLAGGSFAFTKVLAHMSHEILKQSAIFKDLDDFQLEIVSGICEVVELGFDEYVFREGDEGDRLYVIERGEVRISRVLPGTGEEALTVLKRGACFGEMAILDQSERSTDAIANTRCTLLSISRANFEAMLESDMALANKVLWSVVHMLCERLRMTNETLRSLLVMAMF